MTIGGTLKNELVNPFLPKDIARTHPAYLIEWQFPEKNLFLDRRIGSTFFNKT